MHSNIEFFLGSIFGGQKARSLKPVGGRRHRRLFAEQLESRFAMSTLTGGDVPLDAPASIPGVGTSEVEAGTSSGAPSNMDPPPLDPPPPGPVNQAPQIVNYGSTFSNGWCILSGTVIDDQDPTGNSVVFGGLIFDSTLVLGNDTFSYSFQVSEETHGSISATFTDMYGSVSNIALFTI